VKLTLAAGLFVAATTAAFAQGQTGTSSSATSQQNGTSQTATAQQNTRGTEQSVTGCLTEADDIYTLTVMSATPGTTATTTVYTLAPGTGVDLKQHVNKMVTVKGTDAGPELQNSARVVQTTPPTATGTSGSANATGTSGSANGNSGGGTPTVQTTAKARINAKTLNITGVQPATGSCGGLK
jgi:hypothetical protein